MKATGLLRKAAATQVTVLLSGETGVGKERFARALHRPEPARHQTFVAVNCAALPGNLVESELFGTEKRRLHRRRHRPPGALNAPMAGTLFLDELGELPLPARPAAARAARRPMERLAALQPRQVDVRLVAATARRFAGRVRAPGVFAKICTYRLNVIPSAFRLRERLDDIEAFAQHLLQSFATQHDKHISGFTDHAPLSCAATTGRAMCASWKTSSSAASSWPIRASRWTPPPLFPSTSPPRPRPPTACSPAGAWRPARLRCATKNCCSTCCSARWTCRRWRRKLIEAAVARHHGNRPPPPASWA